MKQKKFISGLLLSILLCVVSSLHAQQADGAWLPTRGHSGLSGGPVEASVVDSAGNVYAAGQFTHAGDVAVNHVARWNESNQRWEPLGEGVGRAVFALATDSAGNLYAGGWSTSDAGEAPRHVSRWHAASERWEVMGSELDARVDALVVDPDGVVYAAGHFSLLGSVARWNAESGRWESLTRGLRFTALSLAIDNNGNLIAGGQARGQVARWNAVSGIWEEFGERARHNTEHLATDASGNIYAVDKSASDSHSSVRRWDAERETWEMLGQRFYFTIRSLVVDNQGRVYAAGNGDIFNGRFFEGVARWNPATERWEQLGSGLAQVPRTLAVDASGNIYAGGDFASDANGTPVGYQFTRWNRLSNQWEAMGRGINNAVLTLAADAFGNIYAGGSFTTVGDVQARHVARWNAGSGQWEALGAGFTGVVFDLLVDTSGQVFVIGQSLDTADDDERRWVYQWNAAEGRWLRMGQSFERYSCCRALHATTAGELYVAGEFPNSTGELVHAVARWDDVAERWDVLGTGMDGAINALVSDPAGNVYAAGKFLTAGGVDANRVARWSVTSERWEALGTGINERVREVSALTVDMAGSVIVGGSFRLSNEAYPETIYNIARWNDSSGVWEPLGDAILAAVNALATDAAGNVYAGGESINFTSDGAQGVARWNASTGIWEAMGAGVGRVHALAIDHVGDVHVGGSFTGSINPEGSPFYAVWSPLAVPADEGTLTDAGDENPQAETPEAETPEAKTPEAKTPEAENPAEPTSVLVDNNTIRWPDNGWYQVQDADTFVSLCEGGRSCDVSAGFYTVINHTTGERFERVEVTLPNVDSRVANTIVVDGSTIRWPDNGWYQVQNADTYQSVCEGGRSCVVNAGSYIVINHTTGERFAGVTVATAVDRVLVDNTTIRWPDNGWYQVQNAATYVSLCEGGLECRVEPGDYMVINHTSMERTHITVDGSEVASDVLSVPVAFSMTVPAYSSNELQVRITWNDRVVWSQWVQNETWQATADFPGNTEGMLNVTFFDRNGDIVLGTYDTQYQTGDGATETLHITADQFDTNVDSDNDGHSNLNELRAGTNPLAP